MNISVITPSYNQAQFLPVNLNSVRSQSYKLIEHITVDPGSTDGSTLIAANYPGVTLIAEPDRGQSDGICKGLLKSSGDVLTWLNSDDFYPDQRVIESVACCFQDNPEIDIVYGNVDFVGEKGEFLRKGFVNENADRLLDSFHYQVGIVQPGVFWRRRVFEEIGGPSEEFEYCMDYELWVRMASKGYRWKYMPTVLAHHRWWSGMKTSSRRDLSLREHFKVCDRYFSYIHWKWLDRYADYLCSDKDGVVNHATHIDKNKKNNVIRHVIDEFITQEMLAILSKSNESGSIETRDYIENYHPNKQRFYFRESELNIISETASDEMAMQRVAWNIFDVITFPKEDLVAYHVPENFDRYFNKEWHRLQIERSQIFLDNAKCERKTDFCIVVGNGPSLRKNDLSILAECDVIVSNFASLSKELSTYANYLTIVNDLVAKQGATDFNSSKIIKIVPFWLANYLNESNTTFFVNSTVKPEFPDNFATDSSWRSTVSFFNLQLAYALGYKRVILIGFDHSYIQPKDCVEGDLIKQITDDENHFDPRYFKGKDWQAADTHNMEKMYLVAKKAYELDGREIINCTIGGKLNIFRRSDLRAEITNPKRDKYVGTNLSTNDSIKKQKISYPKILIFDITKIGNGTATGELKENLLESWPQDRILHFYSSGTDRIGMSGAPNITSNEITTKEAFKNIREFDPDVVMYRPVPDDLHLHRFAMQFIRESNTPLISWIMDDWPMRLKHEDPNLFSMLAKDLEEVFHRSGVTLSISEAMSKAYHARYGIDFVPLANGVNLADWRGIIKSPNPDKIVVRYSGGLAENMSLHSLVRIAKAVEYLSESLNIHLEIRTQKHWKDRAETEFIGLNSVKIYTDKLEREHYRRWLEGADILIIAYNFDKSSRDYIQYSMANKLPECLASGTATLAHGPLGLATIDYVKSHGCCAMVTVDSKSALVKVIKRLINDRPYYEALAHQAKSVVAQRHDLSALRSDFLGNVRRAICLAGEVKATSPMESVSAAQPTIPCAPLEPVRNSVSLGSLVQAIRHPRALQSEAFLFALDSPSPTVDCLSGWCFSWQASKRSPTGLRLTVGNQTPVAGQTCIRRRDLAGNENQYGPLMRSGFSFEKLELRQGTQPFLLEASFGDESAPWETVCSGQLVNQGNRLLAFPDPVFTRHHMSGDIHVGQNHFAFNFHQPSKRMDEFRNRHLLLKGWCFSMDLEPVDQIRIQLPGGRKEGFFKHYKPAVSAFFGQDDHFHRCGFEIPGVKLKSGSNPFTLEAFLSDGCWLTVCHGTIHAPWIGRKVCIEWA